LNGADTLEQESIPVEVRQGENLRVLILASTPDFDNRFLASWLAGKGHGVAIRTAISKGKYDYTGLNMASGADELSSLDKFDIVIADAAALKAIPAGKYSLLRKEVEQRGLGLIIKTDSTSPVITDKPGAKTLIKDTLGRTLVSASMYGAGKIILTSLQATYTRWLQGNKSEYASLWTSILQEAARENGAAEYWQLTPALPVIDQPVKAVLRRAGGSGLPQGLFEQEDSTPVVSYLAQHPLLPFVWEGSYWPRVAGWQSVRTSQGEPTWWYAWTADDWQTLHRMERVQETTEWIARNNAVGGKNDTTKEETKKLPVPKGWFYLLTVICCLFLWVERKI
jgi:hypothetical protein